MMPCKSQCKAFCLNIYFYENVMLRVKDPAEFLNATALCISLKSILSFEIIVAYRIIFEVFS